MKVSGQDMSEPLSSNEIEDVLSSIRRLVSEDMRPVPRATAVAAAPAPVVEAGDKLILTPALRVVDAKTNAPVRPNPPPRLHLNFPIPSSAPRTVEINAEVPSEITPEVSSIETVVASLGAAVDAAQDDWEAENGDADIASPDEVAPQEWTFHGDDEALDEIYAPESAGPEALSLDGDRLAGEDIAAAGWAQDEEDYIIEDEIVASAEDDEMLAPADAEPDPIWVAAAEASVIAALAEQAAEEEASQAEFAEEPEGDDAFRFNEDVLRELVRDILREELAGSMGERITRNIRKLVRAEIARSLAAQELS
jgi:hypothetical protein